MNSCGSGQPPLPVDNSTEGEHAGYMSLTDFELIFVIPDVSGPGDERIAAAEEHLDIVVESHSGLTLATVTAEGADSVAAALAAAAVLSACGLPPVRSYPDLVTRQDIADRAEVSRQAVGNWVRGERIQSDPFPAPVNFVGGGAWLWGDVAAWLRRHDRGADEMEFPSIDDHARIDSRLLNEPNAPRQLSGSLQMAVAQVDVFYASSTSAPTRHWADDSFLAAFALAV